MSMPPQSGIAPVRASQTFAAPATIRKPKSPMVGHAIPLALKREYASEEFSEISTALFIHKLLTLEPVVASSHNRALYIISTALAHANNALI